MMTRLLENVGSFVLEKIEWVGSVILLLAAAVKELRRPLRLRHIFAQMSHLGVDSLAIVALTMLFTGMVMTLQIAHEFIRFGAQSTIGGVVAIAIGRELGPVLVGVVCAGRVGSAITCSASSSLSSAHGTGFMHPRGRRAWGARRRGASSQRSSASSF